MATWCDAHCNSFGFESFRGVIGVPLKVIFICRRPITTISTIVATTGHLLPHFFQACQVHLKISGFFSARNITSHKCMGHSWTEHTFRPCLVPQCLQPDKTGSFGPRDMNQSQFDRTGCQPMEIAARYEIRRSILISLSTLPHTIFRRVDEDWMNLPEQIQIFWKISCSKHCYIGNPDKQICRTPATRQSIGLEQRKQQDQNFLLYIYAWCEQKVQKCSLLPEKQRVHEQNFVTKVEI